MPQTNKREFYNSYINRIPDNPIGKPFLKWPGGKSALLKQILPILPKRFNAYFEPFLGGGALFFAIQPMEATISDVNSELVNIYSQVQNHVEGIIKELKYMPNDKDFYYKLRSKKPHGLSERAIRLLYLNKTCWNGLYRENMKGEFNVPFGNYNNPLICDEIGLRNASEALNDTIIRQGDFEKVLGKAKEGDLVYLDPPYTVLDESKKFTKYNSNIFKWEDQIRLASIAQELSDKGVFVVVSNAHNKEIRGLYKGFKKKILKRHSTISGNVKGRKQVSEYVFINY